MTAQLPAKHRGATGRCCCEQLYSEQLYRATNEAAPLAAGVWSLRRAAPPTSVHRKLSTMAPAKPVFGTAGLAAIGWVLMTAGIAKLQKLLSGEGVKSYRNFPIAGVADLVRGTAPASPGSSAPAPPQLEYTGVAFSYIWWVLVFQLVVGVLLTAAAAATPKLRLSALALVTVLTTSCFLLCQNVCNAYLGVYSLTHNVSGTPASVLKTNSNYQHTINGIMTLFAGCVVCSVANAASLVFLGVAASPASEEEAPKASEAVAASVAAVEAPAESV